MKQVSVACLCALLLVVIAQQVSSLAELSAEYVELCAAIADHAQAASRAFNKGKVNRAHRLFAMAEDAYKKAVAISPNHPHAFMNFGNALSNANRFDESLDVLAAAIERLEAEANPDLEALRHVKDNVARALYGRASMKRDAAYHEGQGNITEAREFALQQLPVSPFPPRTLHDIATMELMMCDAMPHMCDSARDRLQQAQHSSVIQYMVLRSKDMPPQARAGCLSSAAVFSGGDWLRCPDVTRMDAELPPDLFALLVAPPVRVLGRDGILTFMNSNSSCACSFLSPASDPLLDVFANIASTSPLQQRLSANGIPSYVAKMPLLSLVQFATRSFYHWMCEVLPRLVVAQAVWGMPTATSYNVLIPSGPTVFMVQSLSALGLTAPIEYRSSLSLSSAPLLYVTWAPQSLTSNKSSGFSLAHPYALQMLRTRLRERLLLPLQPQRPYLVVASRGQNTEMRHFDEDSLVMSLSVALPAYSVVLSDASQPFLDNLKLFAAASAVVGAHGGALANIVVCVASTPVVEIGFPSEASWHYEHVARALQLRFHRVLADSDPLHRSVAAARISVNITEVVARLQQLLHDAPPAQQTLHTDL
jgi:tetratricopeptide (TPR) repeat protein